MIFDMTKRKGGGFAVSAVFTQGDNLFFAGEPLVDLKKCLVVTVNYSDGTSETLDDEVYELSGTLAGGISTITVTVLNVTTTFSVSVVEDSATITPAWDTYVNSHNSVSHSYDATTDIFTVSASSAGTYRSAQTPISLKSGYRYRIVFNLLNLNKTDAKICFRTSTSGTVFVSATIDDDGNGYYDGVPSDSSSFVTNAYFSVFATWASSIANTNLYHGIRVFEYPDITVEDALIRYANELTGKNDPDLVSATESLITKFTEE